MISTCLQPRWLCLPVAGMLMVPLCLRADIFNDWNDAELTKIRTSSMDPLYASRDLAILSVTMFDTVNGVNFQDPSFYVNGSADPGASLNAALAATGLRVMSSLYGSNATFTNLYNQQMAAITDSASSKASGITWGNHVADTIISYRNGDGASGANSAYTGSSGQGMWAPTPPGNASQPLAPGWGNVTPFSLNTGGQFRPNGPPALDATVYAADFNEVKSLGQDSSAARSLDQTNTAIFWSDGNGTVTSAGHWNQAMQVAAVNANLTVNQKAKVFAAVNIAMADAAIASWDAKYTYSSWRPITAIRDEATRDTGVAYNNPSLTGNATWAPLLTTPNSPGYISEHAAIGKAATTSLSNLFRTDAFSFTLTADTNGDGTPDLTRNFSSFSQAGDEAGLASVFGGINFRSEVTDGAVLGQQVGQFVTDSSFTPVPEPSGALCVMVAGLVLIIKRRIRR